jgi:hypothetical protein
VDPTVRFADLGCAMTLREVSQNSLKSEGMPEVCPSAISPEGPVASGDAHVYTIGLVINQLMDREAEQGKKHTARFYNKALRVFAHMCVFGDPEERPSAAHMLNELLVMKRLLLGRRYLRFQGLILSWRWAAGFQGNIRLQWKFHGIVQSSMMT